MAVLVTFTIGLIWWVTAWSFGIKAFDAFMLTVAMTVAAAAVVMVMPFVKQLLGRSDEPAEDRGGAV
jgi:hypothetical protein